MRPERFRRRLGFALCASAPLTLLTAAPALSDTLGTPSLTSTVPLAIALGAGAFALVALALVRRLLRDSRASQRRATDQVASLRWAGVPTFPIIRRIPTFFLATRFPQPAWIRLLSTC